MKTLTHMEKMKLNRKILDQFRYRLLDKDGPVLPEEGKYYFDDLPHNQSTLGSIAQKPSSGEKNVFYSNAPNSMGLVFLVIPEEGKIELSISGRFDLEYRYIPDYQDVLSRLRKDGLQFQKKQELPNAYQRYTLQYEEEKISLQVPRDLGKLISSQPLGALEKAIKEHQRKIRTDPRVFRECRQMNSRRSFGFEWNEGIQDQESLNEVVKRSIYQEDGDVLLYDVSLRTRVRRAPRSLSPHQGDALILEIYFENNTEYEKTEPFAIYRHCIMDVGFRVEMVKGQQQKMIFHIPPEEYRYEDVKFVDGYGITCSIRKDKEGVLITESFPLYDQPLYGSPEYAEIGIRHQLKYRALSRNPLPILEDFMEAMKRYEKEWQKKLLQKKMSFEETEGHEQRDLGIYRKEISRGEEGILLLKKDLDLKKSFCLMNEVIENAIEKQGKNFKEWRLFQLGFILTQLESIRERFEPTQEENKVADVLWFSTGGGKTEAYLGLVTIAMFYQRLRGRSYGITAWMRFPLRMLSVQQFQRLSFVTAQANIIKEREGIPGAPFTIGYFTGEDTPNQISSSADYARKNYLPIVSEKEDWKKRIQFVLRCPYCGDAEVRIKVEPTYFRVKHVCENQKCWSNTNAVPAETPGGIRGEIGVYVSDEECYRYIPTVLIGTLDKLAILGHNQEFKNFLGATTHYCPDHGFIREGNCKKTVVFPSGKEWKEGICGNHTRSSPTKTIPLPPLQDPGFSFMIQDELHLLKENLGNFDSHYETLLAYLQKIQKGGIAPKILAATATIREYRNHIHHLYLREARRFPTDGMALGENFYFRKKIDENSGQPLVRRTYVGFLPISTRKNNTQQVIGDANKRYLDLIEEIGRKLSIRAEQKTMAEKLGFTFQDVERLYHYLQTYLQPTLVYVNRLNDATDIFERFSEENQEREEGQQKPRGCQRLDGQTSMADIHDCIRQIEENRQTSPIHEIVATNLVSHGVDLERLNMQFFVGWPFSTSEYLQASSRSGRVHPGIVVVELNYGKLYEHTVFTHFCEYHQFMARLVEAVPINRFAPNVLERTLPGIFSALIYNWVHLQPWGKKVGRTALLIRDILNDPKAYQEILNHLIQIMSFEEAQKLDSFIPKQIEQTRGQMKEESEKLLQSFQRIRERNLIIPYVLERQYGHAPLRSFRDIEKQVAVYSYSPLHEKVLQGLAQR